MGLSSLTNNCGQRNPAGTKAILYMTCSCYLATIPTSSDTPAAPGDTKVLNTGTFTFEPTAENQGFIKVPIVVDSGDVVDRLVGDKPGSQSIESEINFQVVGNNKEQLEFADNLISYSGCLVAILETKSGNRRLLGDKELPALVSAFEGNTGKVAGDLNGQTWMLKWPGGVTAPIVDEAIDIPVI